MNIELETDILAKIQELVGSGRYSNLNQAVNTLINRSLKEMVRPLKVDAAPLEPSEKELSEEQWKKIPYGEGYEVSNLGRVRSLKFGMRFMKPSVIQRNYRQVNLSHQGDHKHFLIHRLVAEAFVPNPEKKVEVNHKDGNRSNNQASNLEWLTNEENKLHAVEAGIRPIGSKHWKTRLTDDDVIFIRESFSKGATISSLADKFGVSNVQIRNIVQRKNWKHIDENNAYR